MDACVLVVVVEERHKETPGLTVRADHTRLDPFSKFVDSSKVRGWGEPLCNTWQAKEEREVKCSINADHVALVVRTTADKCRDLALAIIYLSKGEEVTLADLQRILPHGIAEDER